MYTGKTVFSQVMDYVPMYEFRKCIDRYNGNYHTSSFSCITPIRWINLEQNLYTILQILSVTLFEKVPLDQLFANYDYKKFPDFKEPLCNQLNLFDY